MTSLSLSLTPVFLIGLFGSVHCIGMCGGIVSAFSMAPATATVSKNTSKKTFPVAVNAGGGVAVLQRTLAYNLGRISSYVIAGAIAGGLAGGARLLSGIQIWQTVAYVFAYVLLVVLGLYLMDVWRGLTYLEAAGNVLWKRLQPLTSLLLPLDSPLKLVLAGGLWGWLPCGMVYSILLTALLSGSAASGAAVMLAFGLGTLPLLVTAGMLGASLRATLQRRSVRVASGMLVLLFGVSGLLRAAHGLTPDWLAALCAGAGHIGWTP